MKIKLFSLILLASASSLFASSEGLEAIRIRRKTMIRHPQPVAQIMKDGAILSVYADDSITTQAVRLVTMPTEASAAMQVKLSDNAIFATAKELAASIRISHAEAVDGLTDAQILASTETTLDTTTKTAGTSGAIGLVVGAALGGLAGSKKTKSL